MNDAISKFIEKITSYNLFNNFFPGIVVCCIIEKTTRFSISGNNLLQDIFIYYFVGIIVSRIGSLIIERVLRKLKVKKEPLIKFAPYIQYVKASKKDPFIVTLNETNNLYRTIISIFVLSLLAKLYDLLMYDLLLKWGVSQDVVFIIVCVLMIVLFSASYRKQTSYIRKRVECCIHSEREKE